MAKRAVEDTDLRTARKKHKRKKQLKALIAAFVLLIIAAVIFLTRNMWVPKLKGIFEKPHGLIVNDGELAAGNFPLMLSENGTARLFAIDNEFAVVDDSAVRFYNIAGEQEMLIQHTLAHPAAVVDDKRLLVYESGGSNFEVIGFKGEIYSKKLENNILLATMKNDIVAVVTSTDKYDAYLTVYNSDGDEIYKWAANKRILSLDIKEDGDGCYISTFTSVDGQTVSQVTELDFSSDNAALTSKELDTLVLSVMGTDTGKIWAIGNTKLFTLDNAGNVLSEYEYRGELSAFCANEKVCAVACKGMTRGTSELMIAHCDSNEITGTASIDTGDVKSLECMEEDIFMLSEHSAECYDKGGELVATAGVSNDYVDFVYLEESLIFIGYREINKISFDK